MTLPTLHPHIPASLEDERAQQLVQFVCQCGSHCQNSAQQKKGELDQDSHCPAEPKGFADMHLARSSHLLSCTHLTAAGGPVNDYPPLVYEMRNVLAPHPPVVKLPKKEWE